MNAITPSSGTAVASLEALQIGLDNIAQHIAPTGGDPYLKMSKAGRWSYGAENSAVQAGSEWAVNPHSLKYGWVSWTRHQDNVANTLEGEVMVPMTSPFPDRGSLPDTGWEWKQQFSFQMKCMTGEDAGEQVLYKNSSKGGVDAVGKLVAAIRQQLVVDREHPVPVLLLESSTYDHKKYSETFIPIFKIVRWLTLQGAEAEPVAEIAPEPAKRTRRTKAEMEAANAAPLTPAGEDDELAELERLLAERKAAKAQATEPVDEKAARRAALLAEMAELDGGDAPTSSPEAAPVPGQPIKRRRPA